jgi:DNA repair exonuclease SbcCD ATPase subunit
VTVETTPEFRRMLTNSEHIMAEKMKKIQKAEVEKYQKECKKKIIGFKDKIKELEQKAKQNMEEAKVKSEEIEIMQKELEEIKKQNEELYEENKAMIKEKEAELKSRSICIFLAEEIKKSKKHYSKRFKEIYKDKIGSSISLDNDVRQLKSFIILFLIIKKFKSVCVTISFT